MKLIALLLVIVAGAALSCVSDRTTGVEGNNTACNVQLPSDAFGSTIVKIQDFAFSPSTVRIRPGTKVTWVNCGDSGSEPHTSTSDIGEWDSPLLPAGATYTREFGEEAGDFEYHCTPHPSMQGVVRVE